MKKQLIILFLVAGCVSGMIVPSQAERDIRVVQYRKHLLKTESDLAAAKSELRDLNVQYRASETDQAYIDQELLTGINNQIREKEYEIEGLRQRVKAFQYQLRKL